MQKKGSILYKPRSFTVHLLSRVHSLDGNLVNYRYSIPSLMNIFTNMICLK